VSKIDIAAKNKKLISRLLKSKRILLYKKNQIDLAFLKNEIDLASVQN